MFSCCCLTFVSELASIGNLAYLLTRIWRFPAVVSILFFLTLCCMVNFYETGLKCFKCCFVLMSRAAQWISYYHFLSTSFFTGAVSFSYELPTFKKLPKYWQQKEVLIGWVTTNVNAVEVYSAKACGTIWIRLWSSYTEFTKVPFLLFMFLLHENQGNLRAYFCRFVLSLNTFYELTFHKSTSQIFECW